MIVNIDHHNKIIKVLDTPEVPENLTRIVYRKVTQLWARSPFCPGNPPVFIEHTSEGHPRLILSKGWSLGVNQTTLGRVALIT